ncbi:MAG: acyltransferase [Dyadobacter sp.]|uniref:acyltransferase family protein n=1 Tax=Dyadobacter sp. TaxID=1914288 RepID=UPI0032678C7C
MRQKQEDIYNPQLDGLRTIAVVLVIMFHWFPVDKGFNLISNGPLGVTLFFVLSGFLITRILLQNRLLRPVYRFSDIYKVFMVRRVLRIFPLYYLMLLFVWLAPRIAFIPDIQTDFYEHPLHYLLYSSNFLIDKTGNWSNVLSIFWTLAVEEQFYLFWPIVIIKAHARNLKQVIMATILAGVAIRGLLFVVDHNAGVLMPTCLDSFGLGALWAYVLVNNDNPRRFIKIINLAAPIAGLLFLYFCFNHDNTLFKVLFFRLAMSVISLYLVANASYKKGFGSYFGAFLENSVTMYLGRISYGLYIFHIMVPYLLIPIMISAIRYFFEISVILTDQSIIMFSTILLIMVSTMSKYCFEQYFINLKSYFSLKRVANRRAEDLVIK